VAVQVALSALALGCFGQALGPGAAEAAAVLGGVALAFGAGLGLAGAAEIDDVGTHGRSDSEEEEVDAVLDPLLVGGEAAHDIAHCAPLDRRHPIQLEHVTAALEFDRYPQTRDQVSVRLVGQWCNDTGCELIGDIVLKDDHQLFAGFLEAADV
jgi:hypothetical protein